MINDQMRDKLKEFNLYLNDRESSRPSKETIRERLESLGQFIQLRKLTANEVSEMTKGKGIVGVDGSYTVYGNTFPHVIFLGQALAKYTLNSESVKESYLETGFTYMDNLEDTDSADMFLPIQRNKVAQLEVDVATQALHKFKPFLTMFDGGFWRFSKEAEEQWEVFCNNTLKYNIPCVGVIEDIGSYDLHENLEDIFNYFVTDSDIMFDLLEVGEVFVLNSPYRDKFKRAFARFSRDPMPIACDFLIEQEEGIMGILNIVYNLTSLDGRGFPFWIDVVDKEVKITDEATNMLIDNYLSVAHKEKYLVGKRNRR